MSDIRFTGKTERDSISGQQSPTLCYRVLFLCFQTLSLRQKAFQMENCNQVAQTIAPWFARLFYLLNLRPINICDYRCFHHKIFVRVQTVN